MSARKQALKYTAAAVAVAAIIVVASTLYLSPALRTGTTGVQSGTSAKLIVQLTDPPVVPRGTTSLNLTYSSIGLLVGEPAGSGEQTTSTVTVTPSGGSATVDLLRLQNISQTIASASLPSGSTIYSISFTATSVSIDVNGTKSPVTLATGGSTLTVTLARPSPLSGTDVALLQLNPVIVTTPTGYQMIPSAVGIVRAAEQGDQNRQQVGQQGQLSAEDLQQLEGAHGNLTATLTALSVSGNATTITVEVRNAGSVPVVLNAIGIHGNFTASGPSCQRGSGEQPQSNETDSQSITSTHTSSQGECEFEHPEEVVFVPVSATISGSTCAPLSMQLVNGELDGEQNSGLTLAQGQCADLTFSGVISFGQSGAALVPSTASGQVYVMHVVASQGANVQLSCQLPLTSSSCSVSHEGQED